MAAEKNPPLFGDYAYGMHRAQVVGMAQAGPCPDDPDNSLNICAKAPVSCFQHEWRESFSFNNRNELQQILLTDESGAAKYQAVLEAMIRAGWQPVLLESDGDAYDVIEQAKVRGLVNSERAQADFERSALAANGLTVSFFPSKFAEKAMKSARIKSYWQAMDRAGDDLRMASLMRGEQSLGIAFTAPLLSRKNALRYGEMIRRK